MIIRARFKLGSGEMKEKWAVYVVPGHITLAEIFNKIHAGMIICGYIYVYTLLFYENVITGLQAQILLMFTTLL